MAGEFVHFAALGCGCAAAFFHFCQKFFLPVAVFGQFFACFVKVVSVAFELLDIVQGFVEADLLLLGLFDVAAQDACGFADALELSTCFVGSFENNIYGLVGHEVVLKMKRYRKSDELKEKYSDIDETFEFIKGFIYVIALVFTAYVAIRFF